MASIYDDIRKTLEVTLNSISGLPQVIWENTNVNPTTGTTFIRPTVIPVTREPAHRGLNPQMYYTGLFRLDCFVDEGNGPAEADTIANTLIEAFEATTDITYDSVIVSIRNAERQQGIKDGAWYIVPVLISWYIYN
tara:strand:- start:182 stop:589 length:408 start_codon:yes stop_codon:yes gene_type:complete